MEEEQEPKEATQPIKVKSFSDNVAKLVQALKVAEEAERYEGDIIFRGEGKTTLCNPILSAYIKKAERKMVAKLSGTIVYDARVLIEEEIEKIRRLVDA